MNSVSGPIGVMTVLDHQSSAAIDQAAQWLATRPAGGEPRPVIPVLRGQFGLSAVEACQAIKEADTLRRSIKAGGCNDPKNSA